MNTPDKATEIKAALAAILAFGTALWGWLGWAIITLIICMALDWITGSWAARRKGEWSSAIARGWTMAKLGEITALLVAALCDIAIQVILHSTASEFLAGYEYGHYFSMLVCIWYIFTELGSIVENAGELGAPIPSWLRKGVAILRKKFDDTGPKDDTPDPSDNAQNGHGPAGYEEVAESAEDPEPEDPVLEEKYIPRHSAEDTHRPPELPDEIARELSSDLAKAYLEYAEPEELSVSGEGAND